MDTKPDTDPLLADVEAYLASTGMGAGHFGIASVNDSGFVTTLRRGREVRRKTRIRVLDFIKANPSGTSKPDR